MQHRPRHLTVVVQQTPVRLAHIAGLGAYPAQVAAVATVVPYQAFRLQFTNHLIRLGPLIVGGAVYLARLVGTPIPAVATIGTIEPHLKDITIVGQQFTQLVAEILHVGRTSILGVIAIPGRQVDGKLQTLFAAGIGQLAHHVTLALLPRRVLHRVVCVGAGPHTEAAMVLGREDDAPHASLLTYARPLPTVEVAGVEQLRVFVAEAPLLVGIRVQRVVDKGIHLHLLPPQLVFIGHRPASRLRHRVAN